MTSNLHPNRMKPGIQDVDTTMGQNAAAAADTFATVYRTELPRQVRSATLLLGSVQAAQDIVHDAFLELYRRWPDIVEPGPYLQRAVINRCRDAKRRKTVAERHKQELRSTPYFDRSDIELLSALAALPFNHRAALVLRYYLQYTEREIAETLSCRPGSVGPWIRRGLDRLSVELELEE